MVFTASRSRVSTTCKAASGTAAATHPASARNAAFDGKTDRAGHPRRTADGEHGPCGTRVADAAKRDEAQDLVAHESVLGRQLDESDVRDDDLPRRARAPSHVEPDLRAVERHRQRRADRRAGDLARRGVHARGHVDGHDRPAGGVDALDQRRRLRPGRTAEARAEERIDHFRPIDVLGLLGGQALLAQDPCRDRPSPQPEPPPQTTAAARLGNAQRLARAPHAPSARRPSR